MHDLGSCVAVRKVILACRGKAALQAAENVLKLPELAGLQLYSFRAAAKRDRLYIRLDKVRGIAVNADDNVNTALLDSTFVQTHAVLHRSKHWCDRLTEVSQRHHLISRLLCCLLQLDDKYGSPSLDEVAKFSQEFSRALDAKIGEEAAGKLSVEVSSPVSSPLDFHSSAFFYAAEKAIEWARQPTFCRSVQSEGWLTCKL